MRKILIALCLLGTAVNVFAGNIEACEDSRNSRVEYMRCLDRQIATLENQMTLWENNKLFELEELSKLSGRQDAISTFKKSIRTFAAYADQHCRWQYVTLLPDTIAAARKYKECKVDVFYKRVAELKRLSK